MPRMCVKDLIYMCIGTLSLSHYAMCISIKVITNVHACAGMRSQMEYCLVAYLLLADNPVNGRGHPGPRWAVAVKGASRRGVGMSPSIVSGSLQASQDDVGGAMLYSQRYAP